MSKGTTKVLIFALTIMIVSSGLFGFMMYQVNKQGEKLNNQIAVFKSAREQESSYYYLQSQATETAEERALLKSYFLAKEGNSIDLLNYIEGVARETGVELSTENLAVSEDDNGTKWIKTTFSIAASKKKVFDFIKILETLPYVNRLVNVELSSGTTGEWKASVTMQVRVLAYDE